MLQDGHCTRKVTFKANLHSSYLAVTKDPSRQWHPNKRSVASETTYPGRDAESSWRCGGYPFRKPDCTCFAGRLLLPSNSLSAKAEATLYPLVETLGENLRVIISYSLVLIESREVPALLNESNRCKFARLYASRAMTETL